MGSTPIIRSITCRGIGAAKETGMNRHHSFFLCLHGSRHCTSLNYGTVRNDVALRFTTLTADKSADDSHHSLHDLFHARSFRKYGLRLCGAVGTVRNDVALRFTTLTADKSADDSHHSLHDLFQVRSFRKYGLRLCGAVGAVRNDVSQRQRRHVV